jgi:hypothetical protein
VHRGRATASYQTDCAYSAALVAKIKKIAAAWFFGYWLHICKYRLVTVQALMESFSIEAAYLASYSSFDPKTLTVNTEYADDDELLEGVEADLGIDQGWEADKEENGEATVDVVGFLDSSGNAVISDVFNGSESQKQKRQKEGTVYISRNSSRTVCRPGYLLDEVGAQVEKKRGRQKGGKLKG